MLTISCWQRSAFQQELSPFFQLEHCKTLCCKELRCPVHGVRFLYLFHHLPGSRARLSQVFFPRALMRVSGLGMCRFCPLCLMCALYFSPLLEIKVHFAAVAVPAEFDQDRGTDSSPFPESLGAAVAHVAWSSQGSVCSEGARGFIVVFTHIKSPLDPDSLDFIFYK